MRTVALGWILLMLGCSTADSTTPEGTGNHSVGGTMPTTEGGTADTDCAIGALGCACGPDDDCSAEATCTEGRCVPLEGTTSDVASSGTTSPGETGTGTGIETETGGEPVCGDGRAVRGELCFHSPITLAMGANPLDVAIANFDGDPGLDLITADQAGGTLSLRLGDGAGSFGVRIPVETGRNPVALAVGDFNDDGRPDVVTANSDANVVEVFAGDSNAGLIAAWNFTVGGVLADIAVGDLNGDGRDDVVVTMSNTSQVGVLISAEGAFEPIVQYPVAGPRGVVLTQVNSDPYLDLLVANASQTNVSLLLGNETGAFGAAATYAAGAAPCTVAVGDVNGDGFADAIVAGSGMQLSRLFGNGLGSFGAAFPFGAVMVPRAVRLLDLDRDGDLDLVVAGAGDDTLRVMLNDGVGTYSEGLSEMTGDAPRALADGDLNGDGVVDIVSANQASNTVTVVLSDP